MSRFSLLGLAVASSLTAGCAAPVLRMDGANESLQHVVTSADPGQISGADVDAFLATASGATEASLRVFTFSEVGFSGLHAEAQQATLEEYLARSESVRALARSAVARAASTRDAGNFEEASSILDAVQRVGEANTGPPSEIVQLGNITGEAILRLAANARIELDAAREQTGEG